MRSSICRQCGTKTDQRDEKGKVRCSGCQARSASPRRANDNTETPEVRHDAA